MCLSSIEVTKTLRFGEGAISPLSIIYVSGDRCALPQWDSGRRSPDRSKVFHYFERLASAVTIILLIVDFLKIKSSYPIQSGANNCAFGDDVL